VLLFRPTSTITMSHSPDASRHNKTRTRRAEVITLMDMSGFDSLICYYCHPVLKCSYWHCNAAWGNAAGQFRQFYLIYRTREELVACVWRRTEFASADTLWTWLGFAVRNSAPSAWFIEFNCRGYTLHSNCHRRGNAMRNPICAGG
jgi:hypothetical protein